ncbi:MAG: hypothetical protein LBG18_09725 [Mediterranea sp.]|jgi:hypothetical protein|nr:hypothetical protein [Mediterranea sp.]
MKFAKIALLSVAVLMVCSAASRKSKPVYAFGFSASFTDTVVYCTEIQVLDSVHLDKNGFLPYRDHYSYQLKNYLEYQKGEKNRTCMIYFSNNPARLSKERAKLLDRYKKDEAIRPEELKQAEFSFRKPED